MYIGLCAMNKKLTEGQIQAAADKIGAPVKVLKAFLIVECKKDGFNSDGSPVILFERHKFRERLIANGKIDIATKAQKERPDLCKKKPGGYGKSSAQHKRLQDAIAYDRVSALEACSWGVGQVMGYHWESLGYTSIQEFINAMYESEEEQLEACCRYLNVNKLVDAMNRKDWVLLARKYNGKNYKINNYDVKLETAYNSIYKRGLNDGLT